MQQVPADLSQDDLFQWLSGCYFYFLTRYGKELRTLAPSGTPGTPHMAMDPRNIDTMTPITNPADVFCFWPASGAVNLPHRQYSVYVERLPRKQWKRSFHPQCYTVRRVGVGSQGFDSGAEKANIASIECIVNPVFYSYRQALRMFSEGWESVALTPQLTVTNGDIQKVYWERELVGKVLRDNTLYVHDEVMRRYVAPNLDGVNT